MELTDKQRKEFKKYLAESNKYLRTVSGSSISYQAYDRKPYDTSNIYDKRFENQKQLFAYIKKNKVKAVTIAKYYAISRYDLADETEPFIF